MTKSKTTKKALWGSIVALILCLTMLIGTTFAWFTDSVSTGKNTIMAGNLDVKLEYATFDETTGDFKSWEDATAADSLFTKDLWEPGHTEVVYLKVSNAGTLALKYQFGMSFTETGSINVAGQNFNLSTYLKYQVLPDINGATASYADRTAARAAVTSAVTLGEYTSEVGKLYPASDPADASKPSEAYVALVVYMPEEVGNEANYKTGENAPAIDLGITLLATQTPYESDSFDEKYDEDIDFSIVKAEDLTAALETAQPGDVIHVTGTVTEPLTISTSGVTVENLTITDTLTVNAEDVVLEGANIEIAKGTAKALNVTTDGDFTMNGCTVDSKETITNNASVSLNVDGKINIVGCTFGSPDGAEDVLYNGIELGGNTALKDGSVISGNTFYGNSFRHNCISFYTIEEGATIEISNNKFIGLDHTTTNAIRISNYTNASATINVKDNVYTIAENSSSDYNYAGLILFQNGVVTGDGFKNLTVNISNLNVNGSVVADNGANTKDQVYYVYSNTSDSPTVNFVK